MDEEEHRCRIHWYRIRRGRKDTFRYVRVSVRDVKKELKALFGPEEGLETFEAVRESLCDAGRGSTDVLSLRAVVAGSLSERSTRAYQGSVGRKRRW